MMFRICTTAAAILLSFPAAAQSVFQGQTIRVNRVFKMEACSTKAGYCIPQVSRDDAIKIYIDKKSKKIFEYRGNEKGVIYNNNEWKDSDNTKIRYTLLKNGLKSSWMIAGRLYEFQITSAGSNCALAGSGSWSGEQNGQYVGQYARWTFTGHGCSVLVGNPDQTAP